MTLHPQSQAFLEMIRAAAAPTWPEMPIEKARETFASLGVFGEAPSVPRVEDRDVAGVPIRIYHAHESEPREVILYFHGGGWVLGDIETHDALCRRLVMASGASVINVEYRAAPEHRFPAAALDGFAVCRAVAEDSGSFGVRDRIVVAGDSAGGNIAIAVAMMVRDQGLPEPLSLCGQALIYPVLDATMSSDSYHRYADGFGLTKATMAWFWEMYTGEDKDGLRQDPLASPSVAELSGLPMTHVLTAEYDVLRDEGVAMVRRLQDAGVATTHHDQPGMLHGFIHFAALFDDAHAATVAIGKRCREMFDA